jgi:hypothetical protein
MQGRAKQAQGVLACSLRSYTLIAANEWRCSVMVITPGSGPRNRGSIPLTAFFFLFFCLWLNILLRYLFCLHFDHSIFSKKFQTCGPVLGTHSLMRLKRHSKNSSCPSLTLLASFIYEILFRLDDIQLQMITTIQSSDQYLSTEVKKKLKNCRYCETRIIS